ncbi:GrpB family protein [bacterium]|nr:GrpB family protein [bacterium]
MNKRHLAFNHFMHQYPSYAKAYSILKSSLAEVFPHDDAHCDYGMASFMQLIAYKTETADDTQLKAQDNIVLKPYDAAWPKLAKAEINAIKLTTQLPFDAIEHVGSTAIPGMPSKPILDIFIGIQTIASGQDWIAPLQSLGYVDWPDNPEKTHIRLFKGMPPFGEQRTHHIHILESNDPRFKLSILFRDLLRQNKEACAEYETCKRQLSQSVADDREQYTQRKFEVIKSILNTHGYSIKY